MKDHRIWVTVAILFGLVLVVGKSPNPHGHHGGTPTPSPTISPTPMPAPQVTLAWDASAGALGYHLWLGFAQGKETQAIDVGITTVWTVQLSPQTTYFFVVTAYNSAGESPPSNEISYLTP